jgi:hypothetical protein
MTEKVRLAVLIVLLYSCWWTWFELCEGMGVKVLPEVFKYFYWPNVGLLFIFSLYFAFKSIEIRTPLKLAISLTPTVMIVEDIIITTIHRAYEGGLLNALCKWNLYDHPWYGTGTAWWTNTVFKQLFNIELGLTSLEGFVIANAVAVLLPLAFYLEVTREKTKEAFNSTERLFSHMYELIKKNF